MFSANLIAIFVISLFSSIYIVDFFNEKSWHRAEWLIGWLMIIASIYCFTASIWMLGDWIDPLRDVSPSDVDEMINRPKNGLIILIIKFWPYFLLLVSLGTLVRGLYAINGKKL